MMKSRAVGFSEIASICKNEYSCYRDIMITAYDSGKLGKDIRESMGEH